MFASNTAASWRVDMALNRLLVVIWLVAAGVPACGRKTRKLPTGGGAPAALTGRVAGLNLSPDTQVLVELRRPGGAVAAQMSTNVGGEFSFNNLPAGVYSLVADASGLGAAAMSVQLQAAERLHTVLRLQEPMHVEGVVLDRRERPVPAALVLVWRSGDEASQARETSTNEEGRFVVERLAAKAVTVLVQAPGIGSVKMESVPLPSRPLRVLLEAEGHSLRGELVGVRSPISDFRVRLGGVAVRQLRTAIPDSQGRFVFHGLGPGEYQLRAGGVSQASPTQSAVVDQGDLDNVKLVLEPGEVVSGRVVNGQNHALAGATVVVQGVPDDDCAETVRTDVVGYFATIALPRGKYEIQGRLPGFVGPRSQSLTINAKPGPLTVRLLREVRLFGRVLLPGGAPAKEAQVVLLTAAHPKFPNDRVPVVAGNLPLAAEAAALGTQTLPHVMGSRGALTDNHGGFSLGSLSPGSFGLRITHPEAATLEVAPRTAGEGAEVNFGTLALRSPAAAPDVPKPNITPALPQGDRTVSGSVRDPQGRGLAEVALTVRPLDPEAVPVTSATSTANGSYTLSGLPVVPLLLRAQHAQFGVITQPLSPGDKTVQLRYPVPGGIEGEIVNASGRFVLGAQVTLTSADGLAGPPVQMAGAGFRVLGVPPGEWSLKAVVPGFSPVETRVSVPSGAAAGQITVKALRLQVSQATAAN